MSTRRRGEPRSPVMQGHELAYEPALDGIRGIAVLAVVLFHAGLSWAGGGFLGVEVFFVLSGFLITSLLVAEWRTDGAIHFGNFWLRRARRLLPALFALVIVCSVYEAVVGPGRAVTDFGADGFAALFYVGNWHEIWTGNGYFARAALTSPLQHTWSLAIEEQFYLVWPVAVFALLAARRREHADAPDADRRLVLLGVLSALGAAASAIEMAVLFHGGSGLDRVYYGTDTRASGLLAGAAMAAGLARWRRREAAPAPGGRGAVASGLLGLGGAAGLGVLLAIARSTTHWLFTGGFLLVDLSVLALIAGAISHGHRSPVRAVLASAPLRGLGIISYGLYLWHFPLMLWLTTATTGLGGARLVALRLGASLAAALVSFFLIEQPVRRRRLPRPLVRVLAPASLAAALAAVLVASSTTAVASAPPIRRVGPLVENHQHRCVAEVGGLIGTEVFHVCPPVKALVVGDSIGLTLGMQLGMDASRFGVAFDDDALLGCGFVDEGVSNEYGTGYGSAPADCARSFTLWRKAAEQFHAQAIVVEMGYWDELDWLQHGRVVHLGEPGFDAEVLARMRAFVAAMRPTKLPIVLLSVPLADPPPWPDGGPAPQASLARHDEIDALLATVARTSPGRVEYFDLAPYVTPGDRFSTDVGGGVCRNSDGVHFFVGSFPHLVRTYCGERLQDALLPYLRALVLGRPGR